MKNSFKVPRSEFPKRKSEYYSKTLIKKSASIEANATIICGITIGEYALVGSGTVVTKNIPARALVIGNPGKVLGWVDQEGNRLDFNQKGINTCGQFQLKNNVLKKYKGQYR